MGDLNTFIQYLAALYFTICIDGALFRRFWSPDYYQLVQDNVSQYKFQQSQTLKDKLNRAIKEHADKIENHSLRRGVFMLLFCLFLLVYNAFETKYTGDLDKARELFPLCVSTAYVTIIMIMSGFSMKKWRWIIVHTVVLIMLYAIVRGFDMVSHENMQYFRWVAWLNVYIVVFLLSPIVYQLYINWLYSQAYVQHLISTLNVEYERYLKTKKAIIDRDKNLADECYAKVFSDSYFDNNGQDVVITKFNQAVLEKLITACRPPVPWVLIKKWISIKYDKNNVEVIRRMESQYQFSDEEVIPNNSQETNLDVNPQYDQLIKEYEKLKGVSLAKFCKDKGVETNTFKEYRKKNMKR